MLMCIIAILSFLGAVAYGLLAKLAPAELWKCALAFALAFLALSALFVLCAAVVSLFIDKSWPRKKQKSALPRLCPLRRRAVLLLLQRARTCERAGKAAEGRAFSACGQPSLALRPAVDLPRARRVQHRLHLQTLQPQDPGARTHRPGRLLPADRPRERPRGAQVDPLRGGLSQAGPLQHLHLPRGHAQQDAADAALPPRLVQDRPARARAAGDRRRQRHRHGEEKHPAPPHGRVHRLELIPAEEVRAQTTAELSDHAYAAIAEALEKREGKA